MSRLRSPRFTILIALVASSMAVLTPQSDAAVLPAGCEELAQHAVELVVNPDEPSPLSVTVADGVEILEAQLVTRHDDQDQPLVQMHIEPGVAVAALPMSDTVGGDVVDYAIEMQLDTAGRCTADQETLRLPSSGFYSTLTEPGPDVIDELVPGEAHELALQLFGLVEKAMAHAPHLTGPDVCEQQPRTCKLMEALNEVAATAHDAIDSTVVEVVAVADSAVDAASDRRCKTLGFSVRYLYGLYRDDQDRGGLGTNYHRVDRTGDLAKLYQSIARIGGSYTADRGIMFGLRGDVTVDADSTLTATVQSSMVGDWAGAYASPVLGGSGSMFSDVKHQIRFELPDGSVRVRGTYDPSARYVTTTIGQGASGGNYSNSASSSLSFDVPAGTSSIGFGGVLAAATNVTSDGQGGGRMITDFEDGGFGLSTEVLTLRTSLYWASDSYGPGTGATCVEFA